MNWTIKPPNSQGNLIGLSRSSNSNRLKIKFYKNESISKAKNSKELVN